MPWLVLVPRAAGLKIGMSNRIGTLSGRKEYFDLSGIRRKFHVIASRTKHVTGEGDARPRSRGARRPSFAPVGRPRKSKRAQGRPGARCTRGPVCLLLGKNAHEHTGSAEAIRPSLRGGWPAYSALSPVTGLSCHRHPPGVLSPANLTPASGCQDHTPLPSATSGPRHSPPSRPPHPTARS